MFKTIITIAIRAITLLGAFLGIIHMPADFIGVPDALGQWGAAVSWIDRETALVIFSFVLVIYIIIRDLAPFISSWWRKKNAAIKIHPEGLAVISVSVGGLPDDLELNAFRNDFYVRVSNNLAGGGVLENVRATMHFMYRKYECPPYSGSNIINIMHGEYEDFYIGSIYSKEPWGSLEGSEKIEGDDMRALIYNLSNGYVNFRLPQKSGKPGGTIHLRNDSDHIWELGVTVSAKQHTAQFAVIALADEGQKYPVRVRSVEPILNK